MIDYGQNNIISLTFPEADFFRQIVFVYHSQSLN